MNFRFGLIVVLTLLLSACNLTLAEDVTPPPDYVSPMPPPTLGPMYPVQTPDVANGAAIYAEKCVPCHGATGMGDGPQGLQLGVTVAALGLPDFARSASLAQWYTTVTRGNIERFMPPFVSLSEEERWDVVAYAMSMHITQRDIEKGKALFESNCKNCSTDFFSNQENMSALSEVELARIVKQGNDQVKAFGSKLTDDETWAVAAYLRTLAFSSESIAEATALPSPEVAAATETVAPTEAGTQLAEATLVGTEQAAAGSEATITLQTGFGTVSGSIKNKSGENLDRKSVV